MDKKIDLRILKTQKKLTLAFKEMMQTTPFNDITVFDLCSRAEVRRATFYKHYTDKYDFLKSIITNLIKNMTETVSLKCDLSDPVEYFTLFMEEIVYYFEKHPDILRNILNNDTLHIFTDIIMDCTHTSLIDNIECAKEKGVEIFADVSAIASFINGGMASLLLALLRENKITKDKMIFQLKSILKKMFN